MIQIQGGRPSFIRTPESGPAQGESDFDDDAMASEQYGNAILASSLYHDESSLPLSMEECTPVALQQIFVAE